MRQIFRKSRSKSATSKKCTFKFNFNKCRRVLKCIFYLPFEPIWYTSIMVITHLKVFADLYFSVDNHCDILNEYELNGKSRNRGVFKFASCRNSCTSLEVRGLRCVALRYVALCCTMSYEVVELHELCLGVLLEKKTTETKGRGK